jgi:hypothetical protein
MVLTDGRRRYNSVPFRPLPSPSVPFRSMEIDLWLLKKL